MCTAVCVLSLSLYIYIYIWERPAKEIFRFWRNTNKLAQPTSKLTLLPRIRSRNSGTICTLHLLKHDLQSDICFCGMVHALSNSGASQNIRKTVGSRGVGDGLENGAWGLEPQSLQTWSPRPLPKWSPNNLQSREVELCNRTDF